MLKQKNNIELPLYSFFKALQTYDKQLNHSALGSDVYIELLETLGRGIGLLSDREELYFVCKAILLKPYHNTEVFKLLFDEHIEAYQVKTTDSKAAENISETADDDEIDAPKEDKKIDNQKEENKENTKTSSKKENKITENKEEAQKTISLTFKPSNGKGNQILDTNIETIENDVYAKRFRLRGSYSSISPRRIEQGFRSLRVQDERTAKRQIDLKKTVKRVSQRGYLDKLVFKNVTKSHTNIVLLIDQGGSMVAFFHLINKLIEKATIVSSNKPKIYFFKNYPYQKLFTNTEHTDSILFQEFAEKNRDPIIILSDAGAARGRYDDVRIKQTQIFLNKLKYSPKVWLNPMPKNRWANNSAIYISELVDMFEATDITFAQAIKTFK